MHVRLMATKNGLHVKPAKRQIIDIFDGLHHKVTLATAGEFLSKDQFARPTNSRRWETTVLLSANTDRMQTDSAGMDQLINAACDLSDRREDE